MLNVNFECNNPYYVLQLTQSHTILCTKFYDFDKNRIFMRIFYLPTHFGWPQLMADLDVDTKLTVQH